MIMRKHAGIPKIENFPEKKSIGFKNHILIIVLGIGDLILSIFSHQKSFPSDHMSRRKKKSVNL